MLRDFQLDESNPLEVRLEVFEYFGTWSKAMLTMFEITLAPGAWGKPGRLLIKEVNTWFYVFFWIYPSFPKRYWPFACLEI